MAAGVRPPVKLFCGKLKESDSDVVIVVVVVVAIIRHK